MKSSHIEISSFTEDGICQTAISNYLKVQPRQIQNRFISFSSHNQGYGGRTQEQYTFTTTSRRHRHFFQHFFHNLVSASKSESITDSIARLKYRRIGEGPSWFSTGKLCVSDLTGTRYCNMEDLPEGVRILLASADPTFFEPLNGNSSVYESTDPLNLFISNSNSKIK